MERNIGVLYGNAGDARRHDVLVFAASHLELDLLPERYDVLRALEHPARLDVVFYCKDGVVNAARRIALLLHERTGHLTFLVPHRCESAGTITARAAALWLVPADARRDIASLLRIIAPKRKRARQRRARDPSR